MYFCVLGKQSPWTDFYEIQTTMTQILCVDRQEYFQYLYKTGEIDTIDSFPNHSRHIFNKGLVPWKNVSDKEICH